MLISVGLTFGFLATFTLGAVYAERKISAFIQDRVGPMETGPYGVFQTLADVMKLVTKELIIPTQADKVLFVLAPILILLPVFTGMAALPFGPDLVGVDFHLGLLFLVAIVSVDVMGILMAGWGSGNKYALIGSARAVAQIISYEIPVALALLAGIMMFGTMDLQELSALQGIHSPGPIKLWGIWEIEQTGGLLAWAVVRYPHLLFAYIIYFIGSLAECNRAPFDLPEAESELVGGFHVEYSGLRFAFVFLAEYGKMFIVSVLAAVVFWGGWNSPLPNIFVGDMALPLADWTNGEPGSIVGNLWGAFWLLTKAFLGILLQIWARWTYPRVRVDQLMTYCWKYLIPAGLVLFFLSGCLRLWEVSA
ncbi:MAG: complex I subunit 1 family protein [Bacteroidota bacterium]